jgi:uncharacterized Fe-S cluster-containing radical SAM superfamily protein
MSRCRAVGCNEPTVPGVQLCVKCWRDAPREMRAALARAKNWERRQLMGEVLREVAKKRGYRGEARNG